MERDQRGGSLGPAAPPARGQRLERLRGYARLLDDGIRVPGTTFRFGLDPILGLVPGLGDAVGAVLSAAIIWEASQRGVPRATLLRMAFNVAMDAGLGTVPVLGDVFDLLWKANRSNLELIEHSIGVRNVKPSGRLGVVLLIAAVLLVGLGVAAGAFYLAMRLLGG